MNQPPATLAFDIATPENKKTWDQAALELSEAGWHLQTTADGIVVSLHDTEDPRVQVRLHEEKGSGAPAANGFAVLRAMGAGALETALCDSIPRGITVDRVVVGMNWTLVRAGSFCGIARSPARGTAGARTIRPREGFVGKELADLAAYLRSTDPLARSLGLAAVNAFWNRPDADYQEQVPVGGFSGLQPPGDGVIIIGGFRGAARRLPKARVVEREPKPGDIPATDAKTAINQAKILAVTAQTLMNGSLDPLLLGSENVPRRMLIGPSAPLCPLLLNHGLQEVSAVVIQDAGAAEAFICETGTMIMHDHIARSAYLRR